MEQSKNEIEIVIPLRSANRSAFVLFVIAAFAYGVPFSALWGTKLFLHSGKYFLTSYLLLLISLSVGLVMHELLHAFTWAAFCKTKMKAIRFGFDWRNLAPFVHCSEYLPKHSYMLGVAMPGIVLGLLPAIISISVGNGWLTWFAVFFTAGAAGDLSTLLKLRLADRRDDILDHSDHLGFVIRKKAS